MAKLTPRTKNLIGVKAREQMTQREWDKLHGRYITLMSELEPILKEAANLRDEIESYEMDDTLKPLFDIAEGIVHNLRAASSGDPDGGMWWILQHADDFDDESY